MWFHEGGIWGCSGEETEQLMRPRTGFKIGTVKPGTRLRHVTLKSKVWSHLPTLSLPSNYRSLGEIEAKTRK